MLRYLFRHVLILALFLAGATAPAAPVCAQSIRPAVGASATVNKPPLGFIQGGLGFVEIAHAEAGLYATPRLTLEAYAAWAGVFGGKYGAGATYAIGPLGPGARPPRHALLLNLRAMIGSDLELAGEGDRMGAYLTPALGYGFTGDGVFMARVLAGPALVLETDRGDDGQPSRRASVGCCFVLGSIGWSF
jgi:hypothetical protein